MKKDSRDSAQSMVDEQISVIEGLHFIRGALKEILFFGALGISVAIAYLALVPKQYKAAALINIAQTGNDKLLGKMSDLSYNIEDPSELIIRMSLPGTISGKTLSECGLNDLQDSNDVVTRVFKLGPSKLPNVVELTTFGASPEVAKTCANTIFEYIKATQAEMITLYIKNVKLELEKEKML